MFSFKAPKQDPLNTHPEIAVENKNYIIGVFYMPYWVCNKTFYNYISDVTTVMMCYSRVSLKKTE